MSRLVTAAILCLLFSLPQSLTGQINAAQRARIDSLFAPWDRPDSPGAALAVIQDGAIVYRRGYGVADLEHGVPMGPETVFYAGSVSKQFTAACILLLAEAGQLSLDDSVQKYIPELPDYGTPLTIRHLVHHTSGLRDYLELGELAGQDWSDYRSAGWIRALIARQQALNFTPGTRYLYSNSGYFLLSQIVEAVSGQSFRAFAQDQIFAPLSMENTHFHDDPGHLIHGRAWSYQPDYSGENEYFFYLSRYSAVGAGGLYTTVNDLAKWDQNFYNNRLGQARPAWLDSLQTVGHLADGSALDYAFGLQIGSYRGLPTVGHNGAMSGYRAAVLRFPEQRFSVLVLANIPTVAPGDRVYDVANLLLADTFTEPPPGQGGEMVATAVAEPVLALTAPELQAYTGHYWNEENAMSREIVLRADTLRYVRRGGRESALVPVGRDRFRMLGVGPSIYVSFNGRKEMRFSAPNEPDLIMTGYTPFRPEPAGLAAYAGTFHSTELAADYLLETGNGGLRLRLADDPPEQALVLEPIMTDLFFHPALGTLRYQRDGDGQWMAFLLDTGRVRNLRFVRI